MLLPAARIDSRRPVQSEREGLIVGEGEPSRRSLLQHEHQTGASLATFPSFELSAPNRRPTASSSGTDFGLSTLTTRAPWQAT